MAPSADELSGIEKASVLLITLGSKTASDVLKHMSADEIQRLASHIANSKDTSADVQDHIVEEFVMQRYSGAVAGGLDYVKEILETSLGPLKAKEILDDIASGSSGRPFDWIKSSNISQLASSLSNERPQVVSLILAHLPANHAADIMAQLPQEVQGNVAYRLTSMRPVAPEVVKSIDDILRDKLSRERRGALRSVGGVQSLVTILNNADRSTEGKIMEYLEQTQADIAESVKQLMFVFENMVSLDDRALQLIIRELDPDDLRLSLKGTPEEIKATFFKNMSERAVDVLKEDLEMMGPVKLRDVEAARRRVVAVVHRLDEIGEISIRPNEEEVVI